MARAVLYPWVPTLPPDLVDSVLADVAGEIRREVMGDQFARTRWEYRGIQPRPARSPASEQWRTVTTDRGVEIQNPASRRGVPYVRFIHYAGTPTSDRVFAAMLRARLPAWTAWATRRLTEAVIREGGRNGGRV